MDSTQSQVERAESSQQVRLMVDEVDLLIRLRDTPSAEALSRALPVESVVGCWGDELSFALTLDVALEDDARQEVEPGTLCYWIEGGFVLLPFGPTPISLAESPKMLTRCNVVGFVVAVRVSSKDMTASAENRGEFGDREWERPDSGLSLLSEVQEGSLVRVELMQAE